MKKLLTILLVPAFAAFLLTGCLADPIDKDPDGFCEGTSCETLQDPLLSGVFVSGHLGNYSDCPEDGFSSTDIARDTAPPEGDVAAGACAPDSECQPIINCEDASVVVNLDNSGEALGVGIQVDRIELYNLDGVKVAELPVIGVTDGDNASFDGELAVGETVTLRVDYQGPIDPFSLLQTESADSDSRFASSTEGTVKVIISADNHAPVTIEGKSIYSVPSVDT